MNQPSQKNKKKPCRWQQYLGTDLGCLHSTLKKHLHGGLKIPLKYVMVCFVLLKRFIEQHEHWNEKNIHFMSPIPLKYLYLCIFTSSKSDTFLTDMLDISLFRAMTTVTTERKWLNISFHHTYCNGYVLTQSFLFIKEKD